MKRWLQRNNFNLDLQMALGVSVLEMNCSVIKAAFITGGKRTSFSTNNGLEWRESLRDNSYLLMLSG